MTNNKPRKFHKKFGNTGATDHDTVTTTCEVCGRSWHDDFAPDDHRNGICPMGTALKIVVGALLLAVIVVAGMLVLG